MPNVSSIRLLQQSQDYALYLGCDQDTKAKKPAQEYEAKAATTANQSCGDRGGQASCAAFRRRYAE